MKTFLNQAQCIEDIVFNFSRYELIDSSDDNRVYKLKGINLTLSGTVLVFGNEDNDKLFRVHERELGSTSITDCATAFRNFGFILTPALDVHCNCPDCLTEEETEQEEDEGIETFDLGNGLTAKVVAVDVDDEDKIQKIINKILKGEI